MKKLFILIFAVTFTACNAPVEPQGAGFFTALLVKNMLLGLMMSPMLG